MCFLFISKSKGDQITKNILQKKKVGNPTFFILRLLQLKHCSNSTKGDVQNSRLEVIVRNKFRRCLSVDQDSNNVHQGKDQPIYRRIYSGKRINFYLISMPYVKVKSIKFRRNRELNVHNQNTVIS